MLRLILSPAKTMNFELPAVQLATQGDYQASVHAVFSSLASKSKAELKKLLAVSDQLAQLNFDRMKAFVGNPAAVTVRGTRIYAHIWQCSRPTTCSFQA